MPMTAAFRPMSGGAALVAFAMTAAADLAPPALALPSWPTLGGSFIFSCATAVTAASMSTPFGDATILRMVTSSSSAIRDRRSCLDPARSSGGSRRVLAQHRRDLAGALGLAHLGL